MSISSYAENRIDPYEKSEPFRTHALCLHAFMDEPRTPAEGYLEGLCEGIAFGAVTALGVLVRELQSIERTPSMYVQCLDSQLIKMGSNPRIALMEAMDKDRSQTAAIPMNAVYTAMKNRLIRLCDKSK